MRGPHEAPAEYQGFRLHSRACEYACLCASFRTGSDLRILRQQTGSVRALLLPLRRTRCTGKTGCSRHDLPDLRSGRCQRIYVLPELRFAGYAVRADQLGLPDLRRNSGREFVLLPDVRTPEDLNCIKHRSRDTAAPVFSALGNRRVISA